MRVGVEIRNIHFGVSGGIAPLIRGVVGTAMRRHPDVEFVVYPTLFNSGFFGDTPSNARVEPLPPAGYWERLGEHVREAAVDVLFRGYPGPDVPGVRNAHQIVLVPDLQHERFPEFFSISDLHLRRRLFRSALHDVGAIATISEYARKTLLERDMTSEADVFLMPPASSLLAQSTGESVSHAFVERVRGIGEYIFFPANLWPHKNHERLVDAFSRFRRSTGRPTALVLSGHADGWDRLRRQTQGQPVHHLGFVSSAELRYLYEHARALAFFSLHEGFGMPLLEAFECGCPVGCSDTTSLPEVAGGAALMCDPTDVDAIADVLVRLTTNEALRSALVTRGHQRAGAYTWEASADAFIDACRRVAGPRVMRAPASHSSLRVTIVTPSFNQARFLGRTIESVLSQPYDNIEHIVIDGGSTDGSVDILCSYGDRIRWISERDDGQADAINKGFARSTGDIRAYLNSDDTLTPGAVSAVVDFFASNPEVDLVYGDANYIDEDDVVTGKYATAEYSFARLMFDCCICQPAAFWRKSIGDQVGPFDASLHLVMDYDYWLRVDRAGGILRHLPKTLANSRLYADTKTMSRRAEIYRELFAVCRRHGGYVDRNYYLGYWNHLLHEREGIVPRTLRRVNASDAALANLHYLWDDRQRRFRDALTVARERAVRPMFARARRMLTRARSTSGRRGVQGFYLDGWLAPDAIIDTASLAPGRRFYLSGRAATRCTLSIVQGSRRLHTQPLAPENIDQVIVDVAGSEPLRLTFSSHIVDAAQRRLAFLVLGTDLFGEGDVR